MADHSAVGDSPSPAGGDLVTRAAVGAAEAGALPLSHRLSIVYLAAPMVVWLVSWFKWWVGVPLAGLLIAGLWRSLSGSWRVSLSLRLGVLLLAALAWMSLTPVSGLWKFNSDFYARYIETLDLGRGGWPSYFTDYLHGDPPLFVYYLGWQIIPSLAGKWIGSTILSWAIPVYTGLGIWLIFVMFTRGLSNLRTQLIGIAILVFFSGMDALEYILHVGPFDGFKLMSKQLGNNLALEWPSHVPYLSIEAEYYSNSTALWQSPNHFIPAGLISLIIIGSRNQPRFAAVSGLVITICLFWSPVVAVGLVPLVAALMVKDGIRPFLKWPNLLVVPPLIALISLYLLSTDLSGHDGWLWQYYPGLTSMLTDLLRLYLAEFVLLAIVLWRMNRCVVKEPMFIACLAVLTVAPLYVFGSWPDQHYAMTRGTIPALVVLTYYTARALMAYPPETEGRADTVSSSTSSKSPRILHPLLIIIVAIGMATSFSVLLRTTNSRYGIHEYERIERTSLIHENPRSISERTASTVPDLLQSLLRDNDQKGLPTGEPIIRSKYDIYLQEQTNSLVYLNRNCILGSEEATSLFLHIYPTDNKNLSENRMQIGYDTYETQWITYPHYKGGTHCIGSFGLPDYDIARIIVGQYTPYLGVDWAVEYQLNDNGQPDITYAHRFNPINSYHPYYSYYQMAERSSPIIRSTFNVHLVHLHKNTLIYTKNPCSESDTSTPFLLHIIPIDRTDLPTSRRQLGFKNYDFRFNSRGTIFDDRCLAMIPLPDYGIASIRTGQFDPDESTVLWQEEAIISQ